MKNKTAIIFLLVSIFLYAISLIVEHGWRALILGAEYLFTYDLYFWFANPLIILSWIFYRKVWGSFLLSLFATILSYSFFYTAFKQGIEIVSAIWLSSMAVMLIGNIIRLIQSYRAVANRK